VGSTSSRAAGALCGDVKVDLRLRFADRRRRDADNCAKSICGALDGIAWHDDVQVAELHIVRGIDRHHPRVEITIEKLKEASVA
jgi:Holliday junction resolvase RusA-like endonuclease